MFVRIIFEGDNAQSKSEVGSTFELQSSKLLVNPDCPIRVIYDYIQRSFGIKNEQDFDLCDDNGNLIFIYDKEPCSNGTSYLTPKGTYFVVLFERDEDNRLINPNLSIPESFRKTPVQINDMVSKIKKQMNPSLTMRGSKSSKNRSSSSAFPK